MTFKIPLLVAAALLLAAPTVALADPGDHGRGRGGGWAQRSGYGGGEGRGRFEPGGGRFGRGGPDAPARARGGGRPDRGWDGGGPVYAGPGNGRGQGRPEREEGPPPRNYDNQDWRGRQGEARQGVREGRYIGLGRAVGEVARRHPGRQLDAGFEQGPSGEPAYRIRWAGRDGQRMDVIVDARTGQILSEEGH